MKKYRRNFPGQGLIEYGIFIALGSVAVIYALSLFGVSVKDIYRGILLSLAGESNIVTLFSDEFENLDSWSTLNNGFWWGDWSAEDGKLVGSELASTFLDDFSGTDYSINLDSVALDQIHSSWNGFGVFFRTNDVDNLDGYIFEVEKVSSSSSGVLMFRKWENGNQINTPLASTALPADFDWDNPGDIRIDVQGDTFSAYINDTQVLTVQDDSWQDGGVGVAVNYGS